VGCSHMTLGFRPGHGVSDPFLDHLDKLARQNGVSWWRDVLMRDDIFVAVRRNSLNVYYRGGSIFRIDDQGDGTPSPKTHVKYLVRQQQVLAELIDGQFVPNAIGWTHYTGPETLNDMIRAASDLAGPEKTGLHPLIVGGTAVIDVEVALGRAGEAMSIESATDGSETSKSTAYRNQDRLDVATLERQGRNIAVVFHEAKHFTNPELRVRSGAPPVVGQLRRYRTTLAHHAPALIERYQAACRALVRFDAMSRAVRMAAGAVAPSALDPLIGEFAEGRTDRVIDPEARLIVFGFDADQKRGQLQAMLGAIRTAEPTVAIYAVGDPTSAGGAFRPPIPPKSRQKDHT
jgi:hypothetical protein